MTTPNSREKLLTRLREIAADEDRSFDTETAHYEADRALIEYVDDAEITAAYDAIGKWYA